MFERTEMGVRLGTLKTADVRVVIWEDFGSPDSKKFEQLSKTFLQDAARKGTTTVEYRPYVEYQPGEKMAGTFSFQAMAYELDVVQKDIGPEEDAYYLRSALYAQQSTNPHPIDREQLVRDGVRAGATEVMMLGAGRNNTIGQLKGQIRAAEKAMVDAAAPSIFVNGKRLSGSSPAALAKALRASINGSSA